jgi:dihydroorotate dehydrogenase electron transfer subunit
MRATDALFGRAALGVECSIAMRADIVHEHHSNDRNRVRRGRSYDILWFYISCLLLIVYVYADFIFSSLTVLFAAGIVPICKFPLDSNGCLAVAHFRRWIGAIPPEVFFGARAMTVAARSQYLTHVTANQSLCREHFRLVLSLPEFPPTEPGQFIQIACRDLEVDDCLESDLDWQPGRPVSVTGRELLGPLALIRRPFSLAGRRDDADGVKLEVIHRVVGVGTDWMSRLKVGDSVGVIGPLGNRFTLPARNHTAILVGGGVGIPPMLYLGDVLAKRGHDAVGFFGATTADLLPATSVGNGFPTIIATDDGSSGRRGLVTEALEEWIVSHARKPIIYTCGPEPMMKRVAAIAAERGLECQVAVERAMACGMGTCQSCVIRLRLATPRNGRDWAYRLSCTDGPIFRSADLLW